MKTLVLATVLAAASPADTAEPTGDPRGVQEVRTGHRPYCGRGTLDGYASCGFPCDHGVDGP